jgi:hypothetical protein
MVEEEERLFSIQNIKLASIALTSKGLQVGLSSVLNTPNSLQSPGWGKHCTRTSPIRFRSP